MTIPACKDCKHCYSTNGLGINATCSHPILNVKRRSSYRFYKGEESKIVMEKKDKPIEEMREGITKNGRILMKGKCGIEGRLFEPKDKSRAKVSG